MSTVQGSNVLKFLIGFLPIAQFKPANRCLQMHFVRAGKVSHGRVYSLFAALAFGPPPTLLVFARSIHDCSVEKTESDMFGCAFDGQHSGCVQGASPISYWVWYPSVCLRLMATTFAI